MPKQIHPATVAEKLNAGEPIYLLDVREQWEYDHCHLPNSVLIPLGELSHRFSELDIPEGANVVVYCHHGVRSLSGAAILEMNGLTDVYSMAGGIEAWSLLIDPRTPRY